MGAMADTKKVLDMIKEHDAKYVDFRFTDPRGKWQHLAHHIRTITDEFLTEGVMFDGSSIAGWKAINESDMLLAPDCSTAVLDPFAAQTSVIVFCDVHEPLTGQPYSRDPRSTAKKAEQYLVSTGIGDTAYFGPEAEFFIFDDVRYESTMQAASYSIDAEEGPWVSAKQFPDGNTGHRRRSRAAISRSRRSTARATCGPKCCQSCMTWASRSRSITTRSPPARPSSAPSSTLWCAPPTTCRSTSMSCTTWPTSTARPRPLCRSRSRAITARACTLTSRCGKASGRLSPAISTPTSARPRST